MLREIDQLNFCQNSPDLGFRLYIKVATVSFSTSLRKVHTLRTQQHYSPL